MTIYSIKDVCAHKQLGSHTRLSRKVCVRLEAVYVWKGVGAILISSTLRDYTCDQLIFCAKLS